MRKLRNSELNRLSTDEFKSAIKTPIIIALDDVRSMHNVGSVFRTSDAFRIEKIILGGITPTPPLPEIEKSALGATQSVAWIHSSNLAEELSDLKARNYKILAFEQTDSSIELQSYYEKAVKMKCVLVFGNEVKGVSEEVLSVCDDVLEIPQIGTKHSLNISVSAAIAIWEMTRKDIKKGAF